MRFDFLAVCALILGLPAAVQAAKEWTFEYRPTAARYAIYGGELGDTTPPSERNKRISIYLEGAGARDIFNLIGPDLTDVCGAEDSTRIREKDDGRISCSYAPKDGYRCYVGFDLRTGKSIGGVSC